MKKIAIFGGSFNPPTKAHFEVAQRCLEIVDEVWLMPCYVTYYNKKIISPEHRVKMCEIAIDSFGNKSIKVCDFEIKNKLTDESYPIMRKFLQEYNAKFHFVIGMDNANKIDTWTNWDKLIDMLPFIIIPRKGYKKEETKNWYLKEPHIFLKGKGIAGSSTEVRNSLKNNIKSNLIFDAVYDYITKYNLFD